jgi:hypothetical protein
LEADAEAAAAEPQKKRGRKANLFVANQWNVSNKCAKNTDFYKYIGKFCVDEEVNKTFKILNVFENSKYSGQYFFGYVDVNSANIVDDMEYSTCKEILSAEDGFRIINE